MRLGIEIKKKGKVFKGEANLEGVLETGAENIPIWLKSKDGDEIKVRLFAKAEIQAQVEITEESEDGFIEYPYSHFWISRPLLFSSFIPSQWRTRDGRFFKKPAELKVFRID